ncbi:hypothetical protein GCM10010193_69310 [Kitasatospora atroaurantiaca]|uniref:helix-turn-helix domain-containing protein n=1 Tax=Kitasatospora atroaurantiaca TaxID=285545 RepID=UPI0011AA7FB4|nr:helix-turn-helix transcriptional regulator [Kitasatospora atroaurantiaca]
MPNFDNAFFDKTAKEAGDSSTSLIAARTGLDRGHVSRLLKGDTEPTLKTVKRIADAYGLPLDDFVCERQAA